MVTSPDNYEKEMTGSIHSKSGNLTQQHHATNMEKSFEEEQIEHVPEGTASNGKALFMLLKAFIGTGVVFLPGSFASGGLILSIILMVVISSICLIAFLLLIKAQMVVGGDYGDVAFRLYGPWLRYLILLFLCMSQIGFVSSYIIFASQNLGLVVDQLSHCHRAFPESTFIWLSLVIIIPITWVRKIARLSWNAIIADTFILFGLLSVIYFTSQQLEHNGLGPNLKMVNSSDFALMIGTAVFSFEGIGMVLPIIQGMKRPDQFPRVLILGMIICTCLFVLIGTLGYVAYGEGIHASVVSNLPPQNSLAIAVQLFYAIAMILTSPFVLYPPLKIVEQGLFGDHRSGRVSLKYKWGKNFARSMVPIVAASISYSVGPDGLNKFVALVGSLCCIPLCFIFPGLFHYKITKNRWEKVADVVMVLWGFGIMIFTLCINIQSWIVPADLNNVSPNICPL